MSTLSSTNVLNSTAGRIATARTGLGLSQAEISAKLGLNLRSYQNYERGERDAPIALVSALYTVFQINPVWLLTGTGNITEHSHDALQLDAEILEKVVEEVEKFSIDLPKPLTPNHKARLISLLYEKTMLLSVVNGKSLDDDTIRNLLKLTG